MTNIEQEKIEKLCIFLDALDEWGVDNNEDRAKEIIKFQSSSYDLSDYNEDTVFDEEEYRREQEADYRAHVSQLRREREW